MWAGVLEALRRFFPKSTNGNPKVSIAEDEIQLRSHIVSGMERGLTGGGATIPSWDTWTWKDTATYNVNWTTYATVVYINPRIRSLGARCFIVYAYVVAYTDGAGTLYVRFRSLYRGVLVEQTWTETAPTKKHLWFVYITPLNWDDVIFVDAKVTAGTGTITEIEVSMIPVPCMFGMVDVSGSAFTVMDWARPLRVDSLGLLKVRHSMEARRVSVANQSVAAGSSATLISVTGSGEVGELYLHLTGVDRANIDVRLKIDGVIWSGIFNRLSDFETAVQNAMTKPSNIDVIVHTWDNTNLVYRFNVGMRKPFGASVDLEIVNGDTVNALTVNFAGLLYFVHTASHLCRCRPSRDLVAMLADGAVTAEDVKRWLEHEVEPPAVVEHLSLTPSEVVVDFEPYESAESVIKALERLGVVERASCAVER